MHIVLKAKSEDMGWKGVIKTTVMRGKRIEAKIFSPHETRAEFQIEMNGLAFYRPTLDLALEFVRKSREDFSNAFADSEVTVSLEKI